MDEDQDNGVEDMDEGDSDDGLELSAFDSQRPIRELATDNRTVTVGK